MMRRVETNGYVPELGARRQQITEIDMLMEATR